MACNTSTNQHIEHLEDILFNDPDPARGLNTIRHVTNGILAEIGDRPAGLATITSKWDGAPAVVFGTNPENGKFFVGTKSVFAQNAKINYTVDDIKKNHPSESLQEKLIAGLEHFPSLGITGIVQGDLLWTSDKKIYDGMLYVQPNTLTYRFPAEYSKYELGVVIHTVYSGATMDSLMAGFDTAGIDLCESDTCWAIVADVDISSAGHSDFTEVYTLLESYNERASHLESIFELGGIMSLPPAAEALASMKQYVNVLIREYGRYDFAASEFLLMFRVWYSDKRLAAIDKYKKQETKDRHLRDMVAVLSFIAEHKYVVSTLYTAYVYTARIKNALISALDSHNKIKTFVRGDDGNYMQCSGEGYVVTSKFGTHKLVNRNEFSARNFKSGKPGSQWNSNS